MQLTVEQEATLREMVDLRFVIAFDREQRIRLGRNSLPQRLRRSGEQLGERESFELAAAEKRLARGDVAVDDTTVRVREHHRERRRLNDGVEQQLALIERLTFLAQHVAEAVVAFHERGQLRLIRRADAHAEVAIGEARDPVAHGEQGLGDGPHVIARSENRKRRCEGNADRECRPGRAQPVGQGSDECRDDDDQPEAEQRELAFEGKAHGRQWCQAEA